MKRGSNQLPSQKFQAFLHPEIIGFRTGGPKLERTLNEEAKFKQMIKVRAFLGKNVKVVNNTQTDDTTLT